MRTFATFAALAATALVIVSTAVAGRPDIVVLPSVELTASRSTTAGTTSCF